MEFKIEQSRLLQAMETVGRFVSSKPISELLGCVYIKAADSQLHFATTDLSTFCRTKTEEVDMIDEGEALIPHKLVNNIIKKLPHGGEITITKKENKVKMKARHFKFECACIETDDYSSFIGPKIEGEPVATLPAKDLIENINKVKDFVSRDSNCSRPVLYAILIEQKNGELNTVALDGYRVAWAKSAGKNKDFEILVHNEVLNKIIKVMNPEKNIDIYTNRNIVIFQQDNIVCKTPLTEGNFIQYDKLFKTPDGIKIEALKEDIIMAVDRALAITSSGKNNNLVIFDITNDDMIVSTTTDLALSKDRVLINKTGSDIRIGFNAQFLLDALKYQGEKITINSGDSSVDPWIINSDNNLKTLVLPIKLRSTDEEAEKAS